MLASHITTIGWYDQEISQSHTVPMVPRKSQVTRHMGKTTSSKMIAKLERTLNTAIYHF